MTRTVRTTGYAAIVSLCWAVVLVGCVDRHAPSGTRLPDFKGSSSATGDDGVRNADPENEHIDISASANLQFHGHTLQLPDGASRSARFFLRFLEQHRELSSSFSEARVLEVGSGSGLAGLAALLLGARVDFTDQLPMLEITRRSVRANLPSALRDRARFKELVWGQTRPDERFDPLPYDCIVAADVVYAKEAAMPLIDALRDFGGDRAVIYLTYVHRFEWSERFFSEMDRYYHRECLAEKDNVWLFRFSPRQPSE